MKDHPLRLLLSPLAAVLLRLGMAMLFVSALVTTPAAAKPSGPTPEKTRAVLQAFVDAYNRHDLAAVMRLFTPPAGQVGPWQYADCDYAFFHPVDPVAHNANEPVPTRLRRLKHWLRVLFAENDRLENVRVEVASPGQPNPYPSVGGIDGKRTNDVIEAIGLAPQDLGGKWILDQQTGSWITGGVWLSYNECGGGHSTMPQLRFPPGPYRPKTRGVAQAFVDAYNDRDVGRVFQTLAGSFTYRDCRLRHRALRTKAALQSWLHQRFRAGERLDQAQVTDGAQPDVAVITADRSGQPVTLLVTMKEPQADHIGRIVVMASDSTCS